MRGGIIMLQNYSWTEETGILSFNFSWDLSKLLHIFWNLFGHYSHIFGKRLDNPKSKCKEFFFCRMVKTKFFLILAHLFYVKLECLLSMLEWCKESMMHHLWWYVKSSLDHCAASNRACLFFSINCLGTHLVHTFYNPQQQEHNEQSCGKLWYCVYLLIDPKFHESWTFHQILFHRLKHHSVHHFFRYCERFLASSNVICVSTNIQCIQVSCLHHTHFVVVCMAMANVEGLSAVRICITAHTSHLSDTHLRGSSMFTSQYR